MSFALSSLKAWGTSHHTRLFVLWNINVLLLFYGLKWIQDLGVDNSGRPQLMSAPLDKLKDDFPLRPRLTGGLLPQTVNLWMGHSSNKGSSSGLHHDFHDNLYVLLRGKKTFRWMLRISFYIE